MPHPSPFPAHLRQEGEESRRPTPALTTPGYKVTGNWTDTRLGSPSFWEDRQLTAYGNRSKSMQYYYQRRCAAGPRKRDPGVSNKGKLCLPYGPKWSNICPSPASSQLPKGGNISNLPPRKGKVPQCDRRPSSLHLRLPVFLPPQGYSWDYYRYPSTPHVSPLPSSCPAPAR
jgi:hypothetical protein